ncbi:MAG: hypothetical protein HZR80_03750 [Candidatus Heimdallarchaeota archaeon]
MKQKKTELSKEESLDFAYEVSSLSNDEETIDEIFRENDLMEEFEELVEKPSTIKIISERAMEIKKVPPPNYSPYFRCILHFRGKNITKRKLLKTEGQH